MHSCLPRGRTGWSWRLASLGGLLLASLAAQPAPFRPDRILVQPRPGAELVPLHAAHGARVLRSFPGIGNLQVLQLPEAVSVDAVVAAYQASGLVRYAERDYILQALATQQGNISRTADMLGVERSNLYKKMRAFGIAPPRD